MESVATYWWIWLVCMVICYAYAIFNQVRRMQSLNKGQIDSFGKGMLPMFLAGLSGSVFGLVLLLSVVLNIIAYAKAH